MRDQKLTCECDGYGEIPSLLMFIGISAGQRGALITKVPLTKDASGRIFQRMLGQLGYSMSDEFSIHPLLIGCYLTNLVKSRVLTPTGLNRLPTPQEVRQWRPHLRWEVNLVRPRVIIALGQFVTKHLQGEPFGSLLRTLPHPRWYQAHGALAPGSPAFERMLKDYRRILPVRPNRRNVEW